MLIDSEKSHLLTGTHAFTTIKGCILLNDSILLEEDETLLTAKLIVIFLHEMGHNKRIQFFSNQKGWARTSEKISGIIVKEAGNFIETELFGGVIDVDTITKRTIEIAKEILKVDNYKLPKFLSKMGKFDLFGQSDSESKSSQSLKKGKKKHLNKCGIAQLHKGLLQSKFEFH